MKTETAKTLKANRLTDELLTIISKKSLDIKRVTNIQLVTLFWEIGKKLNLYREQNINSRNKARFIQNVSAFLVEAYSLHFKTSNLKKMEQFASQFNDFTIVEKIIPFIDWEYISALLPVHDLDLKLSYIGRILKENLSVSDLRSIVLEDLSAQKKTTKRVDKQKRSAFSLRELKATDKKLLQIFQLGIKQITSNKLRVNNPFKKSSLVFLRPLLENAEYQKKNEFLSKSEEDLIDQIHYLVRKYRLAQNRRINTQLNLLLWEIGKQINAEVFAKNNNTQKTAMLKLSTALQKRYHHLFKQKELEHISAFAMRFVDVNTVLYISRRATWEHILILLSLEELEAIIFYVHLIVEQRLNTIQLKEAIKENVYENRNGKKNAEEVLTRLRYPPIISRTRTTQKNKLVINEVLIENFEESDVEGVLINVFENPFLPLLTLS